MYLKQEINKQLSNVTQDAQSWEEHCSHNCTDKRVLEKPARLSASLHFNQQFWFKMPKIRYLQKEIGWEQNLTGQVPLDTSERNQITMFKNNF